MNKLGKHLIQLLGVAWVMIAAHNAEAYASEQHDSKNLIAIGGKLCPLSELQKCSNEIDQLDAKDLAELFDLIYKYQVAISHKQSQEIRNFKVKNYLLNLFYMTYLLQALEASIAKQIRSA